MPEYTVKKLRELHKVYLQEWLSTSINDPTEHKTAMIVWTASETYVYGFLTWLAQRDSKRQEGDVPESFGSKGQETE